jgi:hypothetical protein
LRNKPLIGEVAATQNAPSPFMHYIERKITPYHANKVLKPVTPLGILRMLVSVPLKVQLPFTLTPEDVNQQISK